MDARDSPGPSPGRATLRLPMPVSKAQRRPPPSSAAGTSWRDTTKARTVNEERRYARPGGGVVVVRPSSGNDRTPDRTTVRSARSAQTPPSSASSPPVACAQRHFANARDQAPQPLRGRVQVPQPALVTPAIVAQHVADALGIPVEDVDVSAAGTAAVGIDFTVHNASSFYPDDAAVMHHLAGDARLRSDLSKLTRVHRTQNFAFAVQSASLTDRAWAFLQSSELFPLLDRGLIASAAACRDFEGGSADSSGDERAPEVVHAAFLEAVAPHHVRQLKEELAAAVSDVADMRIELAHLKKQNNPRGLDQQVADETARRREAERRYQEVVEHEAQLRRDIRSLESELRDAQPTVKRLRQELKGLEESNVRLRRQRDERQQQLDDLRSDTTSTLDGLSAELEQAEAELGLWKRRCVDLERERESAHRSYTTSEEALKLSLQRAERRLVEATKGAEATGRAAAQLKRELSPVRPSASASAVSLRSDRHSSALALQATSVTPSPPRPSTAAEPTPSDATAISGQARLEKLEQRLRRTEAELRQRTLQLGTVLAGSSR